MNENEIVITVSINGQETYQKYRVSDDDLEDTHGRGDYFGQEIMSMIDSIL